MQHHQQSHLLATYATVLEHLAEIRQVATSGHSLDGRHFVPIPQPARDELLAALERMAGELDELVRALAAELRGRSSEVRGAGATTMWVNTLLLLVGEQLEDISPDRMQRQYGRMARNEAQLLQTKVERAMAELRSALSILGRT